MNQTTCKKCGTCCLRGGPALHPGDKKLLLRGYLTFEDLITIRKNEPAYSPLADKAEPVPGEFIKISGQGQSWTCKFYDSQKSSCTIHAHRPLECRLLKCWDTGDITEIIGRKLLGRLDLIEKENPMVEQIERHELEYSYHEINKLFEKLSGPNKEESSAKLEAIIKKDLSIREETVSRFHLSLQMELFYFGRPVFHIMRGMEPI